MIAGFVLIFVSWRNNTKPIQQQSRQRLFMIVGWICTFASLGLSVLQAGTEFGLVYGLCGISFVAIGFSALNHQRRISNNKAAHPLETVTIEPLRAAANFLHFIVAFPLAGTLALLVSLQISQLLYWPAVNQLALVVIVFPSVWAAISYLYLFSIHRAYAAMLITASISLFSTTLLLTR